MSMKFFAVNPLSKNRRHFKHDRRRIAHALAGDGEEEESDSLALAAAIACGKILPWAISAPYAKEMQTPLQRLVCLVLQPAASIPSAAWRPPSDMPLHCFRVLGCSWMYCTSQGCTTKRHPPSSSRVPHSKIVNANASFYLSLGFYPNVHSLCCQAACGRIEYSGNSRSSTKACLAFIPRHVSKAYISSARIQF